jgi:hypothetical protein
MKKIIMLLALFAGFIAAAQDCPGERIELLKNKTLKVLPLSENLQRLGYKGFYSDVDLKEVFKRIGKTSGYSALAGKELKVVSYEGYTNREAANRYKLLLETPEGDRLYYDYNPADCSAFIFQIKKDPEPPVDCNTIAAKKTREGLPFYETKRIENVSFIRFFEADGSTNDAIEISTYLIQGTQKGVSVLLSNNAKIERAEGNVLPALIALRRGHMALMILTPAEAELIKNNEIVKTTIGTIETEITKGSRLKTSYDCLINKEPLPPPPPKYVPTCSDIISNAETAQGGPGYQTPEIEGVRFKKVAGKTPTYLGSVTVPSETMRIGTGVMILFEDEYLINYSDAKVFESKLANGTYEYNAVFIIKNKDMDHFGTSGIKGVKVIDAVNPIIQGGDIQKMANCLIQK